MNIFVLSLQIIKCAMFHCDQHVIKMILESAQMLCTVVVLSGGKAPYLPVHQKHPCTLWAFESLSNWKWLRDLAEALNAEYKYRYKKEINHKSYDVIKSLKEPKIEDKGLTNFAQAMPDEFRHDDPVIAYRQYYAGAKYKFATWKNREIPDWYIEMRKKYGGNAIKEVKMLLDPENIKEKRKQSKIASEEKKKNKEKKQNKEKNTKGNKKNKKEEEQGFDIKVNQTIANEVSGVKTRKMIAMENQSKLAQELEKKPQKRRDNKKEIIKQKVSRK